MSETSLTSDAPCHPDGALTFIQFPISLMTKNIDAAHGSATYTLQTPLKEHRSEYGQPRAAFIGVSIGLRVTQPGKPSASSRSCRDSS